jgi:hypothetical protein
MCGRYSLHATKRAVDAVFVHAGAGTANRYDDGGFTGWFVRRREEELTWLSLSKTRSKNH